MRKLNEKGFTLIELLAVIVILGVIMLIAIPSVQTIISNSRKNTYVSSAQTLITGARNLVLATSTGMPDTADGKWKEVTISTLTPGNSDITTTKYSKAYAIQVQNIEVERGSNTKSAYGQALKPEYSYVVACVVKDSAKMDYYIQMLDGSGNGMLLTSEKALEDNNNLVQTYETTNTKLVKYPTA